MANDKKAETKAEAVPVVAEQVQGTTTVLDKKGRVMNPPLPDASEPVKAPEESEITFGMYCSIKKIPSRHQPGMRAFTKEKRATKAKWDEIFANY